jgi:hypothetical protein
MDSGWQPSSDAKVSVVHISCYPFQPWAVAGVETIHPVGAMSPYEQEALNAMKPELIASIEKGVKFVKEN